MRNYEQETAKRVGFIQKIITGANASGIIYGNSGGKDSALVGILCKKACGNTVGVIMPCGSKRNYETDRDDGLAVAGKFGIETRTVDLTAVKNSVLGAVDGVTDITKLADANIAPRLRMLSLYSIAASENRLVAGTGNKSEAYMGYFTKWGDGAHDFNPIADLTVTEIYEFLAYLGAPECVIKKAPSAGLFDGQTDEDEMGVTYGIIDDYLLNGIVSGEDKTLIEKYHKASEHKRAMPVAYSATL